MAWITSTVTKFTANFKDTGGKTASFVSHLPGLLTDPAVGESLALANALILVSDCALVSHSLEPFATWDEAVAPATAPYDRVQDKLLIVMRSADGSPVNVNIPTFDIGVLAPNKLNVDFTNVSIDALVDYLTAQCCTAEGTPLAGASRGYKRRPPRLKKD